VIVKLTTVRYHRRMVTWSVAGRESALGILGRWLSRRRVQVVAFLVIAVRFTLTVAGLGFLSYAAWQWSSIAGSAAVGVSLLLLEYVVKRR